ncbi:MAG: DUF4215 domain-containing protein [Polyangiaceae bacterium]|nr:DUF4215 domain-containing protein [Polyangiaceae bacterium]
MMQHKWFSGGVVWSAALVVVVACGGQANTDSADSSSQSIEQPCRQKGNAAKKKANAAKKQQRQHVRIPKHRRHGRHGGGHQGPPSGGDDESTGGNGSATGGSMGTGGATNAGGTTSAGGRGSGRGGSPSAGGSMATGGSTWSESVCGNGWPEGWEACDDGNTDDGDGCSADCQVELGWACPAYGMPCHEVVCGDGQADWYAMEADGGYVYYASEECDDGNTVDGDGCTSECTAEVGYYCETPGAPCREVLCGDGSQDPYVASADGYGTVWDYELCDDGNTDSNDGCSADCMPEPNFLCSVPGKPCKAAVCGDGFQDEYVAEVIVHEPGGAAGAPSGTGGAFGTGGTSATGGASTGGGGDTVEVRYGWEQCDDGNSADADGCSAACEIEPGYVCGEPGQPCHQAACGDGLQDYYFVPGSGDAAGAPGTGTGGSYGGGGRSGFGGRSGILGTGGSSGGDGTWVWEACDDGNTADGDGCSATCQIESGYVCTEPGQPCRQPTCGDGFQDGYYVPGDPPDPGETGAAGAASSGGSMGTGGTTAGYETFVWEACDDGNTADGDGCSATCELESGYVCTEPGQPCHQPVCGDGFQDGYYVPGDPPDPGDPGTGGAPSYGGSTGTGGADWGTYIWEACDDGNTADNDGCSATCQIESGWVCLDPGQPCTVSVCGDGIEDYLTEECDDGNTVDGDGCSATCTYEW